MVYEGCPMFGGAGVHSAGGMFLNWILVAVIFSAIFWGVHYLFMKSKETNKRRKR